MGLQELEAFLGRDAPAVRQLRQMQIKHSTQMAAASQDRMSSEQHMAEVGEEVGGGALCSIVGM